MARSFTITMPGKAELKAGAERLREANLERGTKLAELSLRAAVATPGKAKSFAKEYPKVVAGTKTRYQALRDATRSYKATVEDYEACAECGQRAPLFEIEHTFICKSCMLAPTSGVATLEADGTDA